ncbi:MAG TPA: hypothetical protein ENG42_01205, partial [Candidatus Aenigmarchaeota archaeon]|nr:hypothetical protein [Candidatus Aenigmarchaeota archaeon]
LIALITSIFDRKLKSLKNFWDYSLFMKILCISDIHHLEDMAERINNICRREKIDVVINAGDFLSASSARRILDSMQTKTFVIYGNWDEKIVSNNELVSVLSNNIELFKDYYFFGVDERFMSYELIKEKARDMPSERLIFITHHPPYGILDLAWSGNNIGLMIYREFVNEKRPILHVFGHVHESQGVFMDGTSLFVNAAIANTKNGYIVKLPELRVTKVKL